MLKARLVDTNTEGLAYFCCDYKDTATQQTINIIKSLVKHVAIQNERSCEDLQTLLEKNEHNGILESTPSVSKMVEMFLKTSLYYPIVLSRYSLLLPPTSSLLPPCSL